ncbi:MAG: hypothetical protein MJY62_06340 [Bacteroidales bacterium]|nr:hypothetical protein [Bacteroidales bacterium]
MEIAAILKSNGSDGELLVSFPSFDPEDLNLSEPVFIYFDELPVPFFISSLVRRGSSRALVRFVDIDSFDDAQELVGRKIHIDEEEGEDNDSLEYLIGWTVETSDGRTFTVTAVEDIPGNPCLELSGGPLIPLHEDFIDSADESSRILRLHLPDGLV